MKGTLTLLADGGAVLGFPGDFPQYEIDHVAKYVKQWLTDTSRVLVLSFPVEVVDLRTPSVPVVTEVAA